MKKLTGKNAEDALKDLRGQCLDEVSEFTPEQFDYLKKRMEADLKHRPIVLTGQRQKGRAAD